MTTADRPVASGRLRFGLVALLLVLLVIGHQVTLLPDNLLGRTVQNALHLPAFGCLGFVVARYFPRRGTLTVLAACLAVGVIFELSQVLTAREASLMDLAHDLVGAGGGLIVARGSRAGAIASLVVMAVVTAALPARVWWSYLSRDRLFPTLIDPEATMASALFSSNSKVGLVQSADDGEAGRVLQVCWSDVEYPGVQLDEVVPDWSGFAALELTLSVETGEPMDLRVAIGRRGLPGTYAYVSRVLPEGESVWRIPLESLRGPEGSARVVPISHLIVYTDPAYAGRCVTFQSVRLSRDS